MKITLIVAMSLDGYIARHTTEKADWTSHADKTHFKAMTKRIGTMVMGLTTFNTIGKTLPGRRTVVLSEIEVPNIETWNGVLPNLIKKLEGEGVKELAICGGSFVYNSFLKAGLVDEMIITVEPVVFGSGIPLFSGKLEQKFNLKSATPIGDNAVVLEYEIIKHEA